MSDITFKDGQSYLLPLDSLDLTYLSKYVQSSNEKPLPLWSQQRFNGESEYFHVKIADQRIDEEDCYFEPLDTYTCPICDLDVPKICYKQHNGSIQHETCKKICEKVLERVAKQININNIDNDWDDTKNLYYCTPCSRAVNLKNKDQHESSDYHKKSEENMSIINDFYKKIIENGTRIPNEHSHDESNSDSDESETQDAQHDIVNNNLEQTPNIRNDLQKEIDSDDECLNVTSISDKNKEAFAKTQELQTISQLETTELRNRITLEQHQPFDLYLKEMISKYKLDVNTPVTDGEYIIIVSPNGDKVKVSREHFHSYKHINKHVYCQVCKMWISQNTSPHEVTEIHVRNMFKRVNENYARMMDTVYSHCLICNEIILTESDHQNISDNHKNLLVDTKIQQNAGNIDHKILCEICNIYLDTQDLKSHNISMEHSNKKEANAGMLEMNNIVKINCSERFCNSCKMNLDSNALNYHINNKIHVDKMSVPNVVTNAKYCEICKVKVSQGGMKAHSFTECFKYVIIKAVCDVIKDGFKTFNVELKKGFQKYGIHKKALSTPKNPSNNTLNNNNLTNGNERRMKIEGYYKLLANTDDTKRNVKCKICDVQVPYNENNIVSHMEGSNHKKLFQSYLKPMKFIDDSKTGVKCRICDVNMPNFQWNIYEHITAELHEENVEELLECHDIVKDENIYKCCCCEVNVTDYFDHLNSDNHTNIFLEKYVINKKMLRKYVYENTSTHDFEAILYRELYRNLLRSNNISELNNLNFYCGICCIELSRISEIDHVSGERHLLVKQNKLH